MSEKEPWAIDLDEVILDYVGICVPELNSVSGLDVSRQDLKDYWWMKTVFGLHGREMTDFIIDNKLFERASPIPGAVSAMQKLSQLGHPLTVITSRGFHPRAREVTEEWLSEHQVPHDRLVIVETGRPKASYFDSPVGVFVDDHLDNHKSLINAGKSRRNVLIDNPWNTRRPESSDYDHVLERTKSLRDFVRNYLGHGMNYGATP